MDKEFKELLYAYITDFNRKKNLKCVVKENQLITEGNKIYSAVTNPLPIVWFGDIEAYQNSAKKILTVALNPSYKEFTEKRFQSISLDSMNDVVLSEMENTLNAYFETNPYWTYFGQYEWIIDFLDSGYCKNKRNRTIHIDAHTAIATYPTWGGLSQEEKKQVESTYLFRKLFAYLKPDITYISVSKEDFKKIFLPQDGWKYLAGTKLEPDGYVDMYARNEQILFHGRNYKGTPFGGASHDLYQNAIADMLKITLNKSKCEGVFWITGQNEIKIKNGDFQFISVFDGEKGHSEIWEEVKARHKELACFHYEAFPRGRVWNKNGQSTIFLQAVINTPSVIHKVVEAFELGDNYEIQEDE